MEYIPAKYILIRTKSTAWFGTDHTMNLYRGCCHGCLYCDSRSDCYHIPDFDRVTAKADALPLLRDELARKVRPAFISMGSMSDPYNPFEKELLLTRHALELIDAYDCGVAAATKSDLILRDADLYQSIQAHSPVICKVTVTTADEELASKVEPRPLPIPASEGGGGPGPGGDLLRRAADARAPLSGGPAGAGPGGGGPGGGRRGPVRLSRLRGDHAPGTAGALPAAAGPGFSRSKPLTTVSGPVRQPVPVSQSPGTPAVGGLYPPLSGPGPFVPDAPYYFRRHPELWRPPAEFLFLTRTRAVFSLRHSPSMV